MTPTTLTAETERSLSQRAAARLDAIEASLRQQPRTSIVLRRVLKNAARSTERVEVLRAAAEQVPDRSLREQLLSSLDQVDALHWRLALSGAGLLRWELARVNVPVTEREDVMQHGYIGLLKAARRFEPGRGLRFSTYARWWVRAQMQEALGCHGRLVRLPTSAIEGRGRLMALVEQYKQRGEPIVLSELAAQTGIGERQVALLLRQGSVCSMEEEVNGVPLGETLSVEANGEKTLIAHELHHRTQTLFKALPDREQDILSRHFGLRGHKKESLSSIGRRLRLSRERVRQVEKLALQGMAAHLS